MPWYLWLLAVVVGTPLLLWGLWELLWRLARRGNSRRITVTLWRQGRKAEEVHAHFYVNHWLSKLVPGTGIAGFSGGAIRVYLDHPIDGKPDERVTSLWVALHELVHGWQHWWMGLGFFPTYGWHRFVLRRSWKQHMIEREAKQKAVEIFEGRCEEITVDLPQLRAMFPHVGVPI